MVRHTFRMSLLVLVSCVITLSGLGCARKISTVQLEPMLFVDESPPIDGTIELCLTPELRMRQWGGKRHPFKIELGTRTALNFEILAKSAFREVVVSFDRDCGSATDYPWLTATIVAANRDLDQLWSTEQNTTITIEFDLAENDGTPIWSYVSKGHISAPSAPFLRRRVRAAEAFGETIAIALQSAFEELVESAEVRRAFGPAPIEPVDLAPAEAS